MEEGPLYRCDMLEETQIKKGTELYKLQYMGKSIILKKKKTSNPKGPKEEMRNSIVRIAWLSLLWQEKNVIASFGN